jgi:hypothetical protein
VKHGLPRLELHHVRNQLGEGVDQHERAEIGGAQRPRGEREMGKAKHAVEHPAAEQHAGVADHTL